MKAFLTLLFSTLGCLAQFDDPAFVANLTQPEASVSVGFDAASAFAHATGTSPFTMSHTVGSGANRALVVFFGWHTADPAATISSVTWNAQNFTRLGGIASDTFQNQMDVWYLAAPDTGTYDVTVTLTGDPGYCAIEAISFTGVDQTTPVEDLQTNRGTGTSNPLTVTSEVGDMVVDGTYLYGGDPTYTVGAGQTLRASYTLAVEANGYTSTEAGAASVEMDFSLDASTSYAHAACNVNHQ